MTQLFAPSEFCRSCRGEKGYREPSSHDPRNTVWTPCPDCGGTGWRAGAEVEAARTRWHHVCEAMNRGSWTGTEQDALDEIARCKAIIQGEGK